jgi:acetyl-CoA synthetase
MFEGVPTYPDNDRYWQVIDKYKVSLFYTAPTALRSLMRLGDAPLQTTKRDSLRMLGSVGEPINPEVWRWYFDAIGKGKCAVVDTWWQTETGGHMMAPPPSAPEMIPGAAMHAILGRRALLLDAQNKEITGAGEGGLFLRRPMAGHGAHRLGRPQAFHRNLFLAMQRLLLHR